MTRPVLQHDLPSGISDFSALRRCGLIYADKTDLVSELAGCRGKIFLARPDGFGKSLLTTTFASLFQYGLRDFAGLNIEKSWKDRTCTVVRLDFSALTDCAYPGRFESAFDACLCTAFAKAGFCPDAADSGSSLLEQFSRWLQSLGNNALVLLIDAYDAPLIACCGNFSAFDCVQTVMSRFFAALKECEASLRFFFMTGLTPYRQVGFITELNYLEDITRNPVFGTLAGLTEAEIVRYFASPLHRASEITGSDTATLLNQLHQYCGGFYFSPAQTTPVFCPKLTLTFLAHPDEYLHDVRYEDCLPAGLRQYLSKHLSADPSNQSTPIELPLTALEDDSNPADPALRPLLVQTGLLSIVERINSGTVTVGSPNRLCSEALARLCGG